MKHKKTNKINHDLLIEWMGNNQDTIQKLIEESLKAGPMPNDDPTEDIYVTLDRIKSEIEGKDNKIID